MIKIKEAFQSGKAFIGFLTAGDPSLEKTEEYIVAMAEAGADLIEIGIPFSDPIAEGPVIQEADIRALAAGTTADGIFEMVRSVRKKVRVPLVFMTYLNPVFHYGMERFCRRCAESGISGLIVPDLPFEEKEELAPACRSCGIELVSMIAPTSEERIRRIAAEAEGFLYVVSSMGVTGVRSEITTDIGAMTAAAKSVSDVPCAEGFGISTPQQAAEMARHADGVIVGSAIVKIIAQYGENASDHIFHYVKEMKDGLRSFRNVGK